MDPLLQPRSRNEPAVSKLMMGTRSWVCQCWVMACQTPIFPDEDRATNWEPIKNRYSTRTLNVNVPISVLDPSSDTAHSRMLLPYEMASIFVLLLLLCSPPTAAAPGPGPAPVDTLAFSATLSMACSMYGEVKTNYDCRGEAGNSMCV